jgi:hypothetical protein
MDVEAVTIVFFVRRSNCGINARCAAVKAPEVITLTSFAVAVILVYAASILCTRLWIAVAKSHRSTAMDAANCGSTIVAELPWTFGVEGEGAGLLIF